MLERVDRLRGFALAQLWGVRHSGRLEIGSGVRLQRGTLRCGKGVHLGRHSEIRGQVLLHDGVFVHPHVLMRAFGGLIEVGEGTTINVFTAIYGQGGVSIGRQVSIAPHVAIVASMKNFRDPSIPIKQQGVRAEGIVIGDDVWLGAHAVVLDGVRIGQGAVVGAGSVVREDVPPYAIVAGVPAAVVGQRGGE
jgi:acetyltransferase-like isoleucine patch superfamily enzyme